MHGTHGLVEFELRFPETDEQLRKNVQHALTLGLPDLAQASPRPERLKIIANGPTAQHAPLDGPTLALNGALGMCVREGHAPTWWAGCDPQALVADFLTEAPRETTYLVASKCHPSVFDALKHRDVILWHLDEHVYWDLVEQRDPIMVAPSITICALELGERLGFTRHETWGWDGCYLWGQDHANPQPHDRVDLENQVGELLFQTTRTWAHEAQNAVDRFRATPRDVIIQGPGMIGAVLDYLDVPHGARS